MKSFAITMFVLFGIRLVSALCEVGKTELPTPKPETRTALVAAVVVNLALTAWAARLVFWP